MPGPMSSYLPRIVDSELDELMLGLPAVAIEGPKGVGKTETALRRAETVYRLDEPTRHAIAEADPVQVLAGPPPILIDEWQRVPPVWDAVRRAVDRGADAGSFLLTGSASPTAPPTHSGAGRIVTLRMRPLSLAERNLENPTVSLGRMLAGERLAIAGNTHTRLSDYVREIEHSGYPGIRPLSGRALRAQLDGYLARIVDRDFDEQGHSLRRPDSLKRWMTAYAAATATTAAYETIRDAATGGDGDKPAKSATLPYRDTLEKLFIIDPVPAWTPTRNQLRRLTGAPKHHLADPALAIRLLGLDSHALLSGDESGVRVPRDGTLLGHLFESLVTQSIRVYAQAAESVVRHLRTGGGRQEIDLIVERADGRVIAIEVKLGGVVDDHDVRHLHFLRGRIGDDMIDGLVVNTGPQAYRRKDGIAVVPAALLGP